MKMDWSHRGPLRAFVLRREFDLGCFAARQPIYQTKGADQATTTLPRAFARPWKDLDVEACDYWATA